MVKQSTSNIVSQLLPQFRKLETYEAMDSTEAMAERY